VRVGLKVKVWVVSGRRVSTPCAVWLSTYSSSSLLSPSLSKPRSGCKRRDNMAIAGDTPTIGSAPVPKHKEWNYSVGARVSRREEEEFRSFELNLNLSFLLSSLPPTPSFVSARR